jgi:hypothetical protein
VQTLDAVADDLIPPATPQASSGGRRRGPIVSGKKAEAVLQLIERDGVIHVEEAETRAPARRRRRGVGTAATEEAVRYERKFERLDRSEIGSWLDKLDAKLTPKRGLRLLGDEGLVPAASAPEAGRILLLVHGTFSESDTLLGAFEQTNEGANFLDWARGHYSHVLTFDHPTLSVSPVLNARRLALLLGGTQASIDVVCHSRGGLVTRWWLEVFDRAPPDRRRAVFVGSPLAGTGLAAPPNIRGSLSLLSNIGLALGAASMAVPFLTVVTGIFRVVTSVTKLAATTPAIDAAVALVPGLMAQSRVGNNQEMISLRQVPEALAGRYFAVKSNFESDKPGWQFWRNFRNIGDRTKDALADLVFEGENDLVVDTGSMVDLCDNLRIPPEQVLDFGTTDAVHHTNYFTQPRTLDFLRESFASTR